MNVDEDIIDSIASLADAARPVQTLEPGGFYVVTSRDGELHQIDLTSESRREFPKRKRGTYTVRDVNSFLNYWAKHSDEGSDVWADREQLKVTAVLDAHGPTVGDEPPLARWQEHRVTLALRYSESFKAWVDANNKTMNQVQFAEFIEDHRPDIVTPPAAELLELAQTFHVLSKVSFRSSSVLKSGQRQLSYVEDMEAAAGAKGNVAIPDSFELAVKVFEGASVADTMTARLRYRINDGKLVLLFILDQLRDVVDGAFEGVIAEIDGGVEVPILRGVPA